MDLQTLLIQQIVHLPNILAPSSEIVDFACFPGL